jgi:hypothetical protein
MDAGIGWVLLLGVFAWVVYVMAHGYRDETRPPLTLMDNGSGMKEPVCAQCATRLLRIDRPSRNLLVQLIAWIFILVGLLVLVAVNWLAGLLSILLGAVFNAASKRTTSVLTCPACGLDAKRLS